VATLPETTTMEEMVRRYSESVAPTSRRKYTRAVRRFVEFAGGDFGKKKMTAYIARLQSEGYSPNTIRRHDLTAIRKFYRVNGLPWPLEGWELPKVSERDVYAPALADKLIAKLIETARSGSALPADAAFLALSTVYGMRRVEIAAITPFDLDYDERLLYVRTGKGGRERWHMIPEVIVPYLRAGLTRAFSPAQVSKAWYRLEKASGIGRIEDAGFHAVRRSLVRGLVNAGLPEAVIRNFLRWKRSDDDMLHRYFSTTVVGEGGSHTDPGRRDKQVDEQVFAVHPFLSRWSDGEAAHAAAQAQ